LQVLRIIQEEAMKEHSAAIHVQVPVDVAAFLLNEKRGEILKIETRHRVTAILIPNKHLETPHYKLDRLKHDDPRLEEVHASYAMAEQADTDIGYSKRQKDEVKPRQEAVVKSITPDTAPVVERKPAPAPSPAKATTPSVSIFTKIANFFRSLTGEATTPVAPIKPTTGRDKPSNDRNDRNRNRNRNRNGRGRDKEEREERSNEAAPNAKVEKEANKTAALEATPAPNQRQNKQAKQPREDKEGRAERQQKQREARNKAQAEAKPSATEEVVNANVAAPIANVTTEPAIVKERAATPAIETATSELARETNAEAETNEEGRRRRRGGRNRNRRDRQGNETTNANELGESQHKADGPPAFIPISELLASEQQTQAPIAQAATELAAPAQASLDLNEANAPAATESFAQAAAIAVEAIKAQLVTPAPQENAPVGVPTEAATAMPLGTEATEVTQITEVAPAVVNEVATPVSIAPVAEVAAPVIDNATNSEATAQQQETPAVVVESLVEVAPVAVEVTPVAVEVAPIASTETMAAVEVVTQVVTATPTPTPAATPAVAPVDLNGMLQQAGLELASTDPEKLKAAQAASAQIAPAARAPRERKPVAVVANEPLVMIETKR
jgi:ribonuclease E